MNKAQEKLQVLALVALLVLCAGGCVKEWQHDVTKNGIHFKKLGQHEDGGLYVGILAADTKIEGYPCKQGWAHFDEDMNLIRFACSAPVENGISTFPVGTWIQRKPKGTIFNIALPQNTEIQGFLCKGTGGPKGVQVGFYPSGRIRCFFAPKDVEINGIPCKGSVFHIIHLHENGQLKSCTLSRDIRIDGVNRSKGEKLHFDTEGPLKPSGN